MALTKAPASPPNPVKAPTSDVPQTILRDQWKRPLIVGPDGEVRAYTRASSLGGVLEDQNGLGIWKQRAVALGIGRRRDLWLAAKAVETLDGQEDKAALGQIARAAQDAAETDAAARVGTAMHAMGDKYDRTGVRPADLGDDQAAFDAYVRMIVHFVVFAIEQFVVCDELETAGTFDRLLAPRYELAVPEFGLTISPEDRVIDDLKTSSTADYFGIKFAVQETVYGRGTPYRGWIDRDALAELGYDREMPIEEIQRQLSIREKIAVTRGERLPWPDGIAPRQDVGLIMHVPSGGSTAQLHAVDLNEGWKLAHLAREVQEWRKRKDLVVPASIDLLAAALDAASSREECVALWRQHKDTWTDAHTAAVEARFAIAS